MPPRGSVRDAPRKGLRRCAFYYAMVLRKGADVLWRGFGVASVVSGATVVGALSGLAARDAWFGLLVAVAVIGLISLLGSYRAWSDEERKGAGERSRDDGRREHERQQRIIERLHAEYSQYPQGIQLEPNRIVAGTAPLPKEWIDERLAQRGETWRRDEYWPDAPPPRADGAD